MVGAGDASEDSILNKLNISDDKRVSVSFLIIAPALEAENVPSLAHQHLERTLLTRPALLEVTGFGLPKPRCSEQTLKQKHETVKLSKNIFESWPIQIPWLLTVANNTLVFDSKTSKIASFSAISSGL